MDPLSALIGGGLGLIGGLMNTSSQQAINAANIQQQTWSAQGGYLPGLVQNANKAGLNPLAVLGSRGPNMAVQVGTQPGQGLEAAGKFISQIDAKAHELQLESLREDVLQKAAINKNTMIDGAIKAKTLADLEAGRIVSGPQPAEDTTLQGAGIKWMRGKTLSDFMSSPTLPTVPWDWMKYGQNLFTDRGEVFPSYRR